ncbi:MAG: hypothetical protein R2838_26165 [Caldilineaceae bacterium]
MKTHRIHTLTWILMSALLMTACVAPAPPAAAPRHQRRPPPCLALPLQDAVADMAPQAVWQNFYALTSAPTVPSRRTGAPFWLTSAEDWGWRQLSIRGQRAHPQTRGAGAGGSPRRDPASTMDMVPQKTPDSAHDFLVDPIQAYADGGWVTPTAPRWADDGIGMAMIMAVLQAQTPPLARWRRSSP